MKIVNRKKFMGMENVVFAKYDPQIIGDIMVLSGKFGTNDFVYSDLFGQVDGDHNASYNILDFGGEQEMSVEETSRDGLFDEDQLFMIFNKEDIKKVIGKLYECIS